MSMGIKDDVSLVLGGVGGRDAGQNFKGPVANPACRGNTQHNSHL
jgi:hypothetical protein